MFPYPVASFFIEFQRIVYPLSMSSTERHPPEDPGNASPADQPEEPSSSQDDRSRGRQLDPGTRPLSSRASKALVIGAFVFIFGLGTVGSILLVDVAETALDREPVAPDSVESVSPNPGEGSESREEKASQDTLMTDGDVKANRADTVD